jgi:menaquinol-cytochrome c reductase iron-sulfur subunit
MNTNENDLSRPPNSASRAGSAGLSRRNFLTRVSIAAGAFGAFLVSIPVIGFLLAPLFRDSPRLWRQVGAVDDFKVNQISEVTFDDSSSLPWAGLTSKTAAWLHRRGEKDFVAYSVNCSHLGCPVRWEADAKLFMCPCHGGMYYENGSVAAGPPPKGLTRYPVRVQDGQVEVLSSPAPIT